MGRFIDLAGMTFGKWTVLERAAENNAAGKPMWHCRCQCGHKDIVNGSDLRQGKSVQCVKCRPRKHGHTATERNYPTSTYRVWMAMKSRCKQTNSRSFARYGGRGICVCERWKQSFQNFLDDMGERPDGLSLERIDNDGNYEPSNCRWATSKEQAANRKDNVLFEYQGQTRCLTQWCRQLSLNYSLVRGRLRIGWTFADAITKPTANASRRRRNRDN